MPLTLEQTQRLDEIRRKAIADTATMEELIEAYRIMRQDRIGASVASTSARSEKAAAKAPVDTGALLEKLKASLKAGGPQGSGGPTTPL